MKGGGKPGRNETGPPNGTTQLKPNTGEKHCAIFVVRLSLSLPPSFSCSLSFPLSRSVYVFTLYNCVFTLYKNPIDWKNKKTKKPSGKKKAPRGNHKAKRKKKPLEKLTGEAYKNITV